MHIHKIADSEYHLYCVCSRVFVLSALNSLAATGWIFVKYYIWGFLKNVLRKFKFD